MIVNTSSSPISAILAILAAVGAINWGLIGAFNFNLVTHLLGEGTTMTKAVYIGVGLGGFYSLFAAVKLLVTPGIVNAK